MVVVVFKQGGANHVELHVNVPLKLSYGIVQSLSVRSWVSGLVVQAFVQVCCCVVHP